MVVVRFEVYLVRLDPTQGHEIQKTRLEQITMLCSCPSFLRKQESRPPAPRPLDAGSRPA